MFVKTALLVSLLSLVYTATAFRFGGAVRNVLSARSSPIHTKLFSTLSDVIPSDEEMEQWLDDMLFSGDMETYMRRSAKNILSDDFFDYVEERWELTGDEDEKGAFKQVLDLIGARRTATDANMDGGAAFEKRLDKILFTTPNKRAELIQGEMAEDITEGFIAFIQEELKSSTDGDSKVVYASILQLIGQAKGSDFLGSQAFMLKAADASLGDQFAAPESDLLASGDDMLEAKSSAAAGASTGDRNEQILAGLMFSQNDILEDVLNNLHEIDDRFVDFLQNKIDKTDDIEERAAMDSLCQTVTYVLDRVKSVQGDGEVEVEAELSMNEIKQQMRQIQAGAEIDDDGEIVQKSETFQVQKSAEESFKTILERFEGLFEQNELEEAVRRNYELCDMNFLEMLVSEKNECLSQGADVEATFYDNLYNTIRKEMTTRLGSAQDRLGQILSKNAIGGIKAMESEVVRMFRNNEVDEALTLLIEANAQQAEAAGAVDASKVLKRLMERITMEKERQLPDENRLIRALLKEDSSEKRKELLYNAFAPSKSMNQEGEMEEGAPLISPPAFINVCKSFMQNFGNVDAFDIMGKAKIIVGEAQEIATELYGEGMSPRDQQKYMFEKQSISVWDLANFEDHAMLSGEDIPWANDAIEGKNPEDVLMEKGGKKAIGGDGSMDFGGM
jgi:hypothetical protein